MTCGHSGQMPVPQSRQIHKKGACLLEAVVAARSGRRRDLWLTSQPRFADVAASSRARRLSAGVAAPSIAVVSARGSIGRRRGS